MRVLLKLFIFAACGIVTGAPVTIPQAVVLKGHERWVTSVAFSPDGSRVASGSGDDTLRVWDARTGKELLKLEANNEYDFTAVAFSRDGARLVAGDGESGLTVWDASSGEELLTFVGHRMTVTAVCFSPDGKRIVSGSRDKTVKVWDAKTGKELLSLDGHTESAALPRPRSVVPSHPEPIFDQPHWGRNVHVCTGTHDHRANSATDWPGYASCSAWALSAS